jgi:hypothetical protein
MMKDLEETLADTLDELENGASLEECLARHPDQAEQLRPLLEAAQRMQRTARSVRPSPVFKARARSRLTAHMQTHPRAAQPAAGRLRFAVSVIALVLAFLTTGTVFAQEAMPGDSLYGWKRASENVWVAVSPDRFGTELALSQRRALELARVMQDPDKSRRAAEDYEESLGRLSTRTQSVEHERMLPFLQDQQQLFKDSGLSVPELDDLLSGITAPVEQELEPLLPGGSLPVPVAALSAGA